MKYLLALFPLSLWALPVDNPCEPSLYYTKMVWCACDEFCKSEFTVRVGFSGDYIFNRQMEVDASDNSSDIRRVSFYTNAGYLSLNLWNRFDLFSLFGTTSSYMEATSSAFSGAPIIGLTVSPNETICFDMATNWSWGAGVRFSTISWCNFCFGIEGAYFYTSPNMASIAGDTVSILTTYPNGLSFKYHEWLLAFGTTYRFCIDETWDVLPYFSVEWNPARVTMDGASVRLGNPLVEAYDITLHPLQQQQAWGYVLGLTLLGNEAFSLNLEGRFVSQRALAFNAQILF
ncbi:MAG: hypothetical protein H7A36_03895 [Chlamydiales bacterium]|nr:hypothetical protein [Chlamydiales bacterium]